MPDPTDGNSVDTTATHQKRIAATLAAGIARVAQQAASEEDLRIGAEAHLRTALDELGISSEASYERVYANRGGRSDAVYGRVVIEYEAVGALRTAYGVRHAAEQLERYLRAEVELSTEYGELQRVVGVGIDGEHIFFMRFRGAVADDDEEMLIAPGQGILPLENDPALAGHLTPVVDGPYPLNTDSVQTFLLYLRASSRKRLTAQALAKQFGPDGPCAKAVVRRFAAMLKTHEAHPKVDTFYKEWDRIFGIVYGDDLDRATKHLPILSRAYGVDQAVDLKHLLFALHTYYAVLMKLLAAELVAMQRESLIGSYLDQLPSADQSTLKVAVLKIESGDLFARFAIQNFLEADFFGWYLDVWDEGIADSVRDMIRLLVAFEPATGTLEPSATQDLLKRLYQYLVPKEIRHDLGEYYTPDWLAELVLDEAGYNGQAARVLDPACGSGTFLVAAIRRLRRRALEEGLDDGQTAKQILAQVVGFELNPLAVIAARTNFLLALGPLVRAIAPIEIPVYLCDSILSPVEEDLGLLGGFYEFRTSVGTFSLPAGLVQRGQVNQFTTMLDDGVTGGYTRSEFLARAQRELKDVQDEELPELGNLYQQLLTLDEEGRDGIWARIIRNAFAPMTVGRFDFVLGNPPWVNWQSLSADYRAATQRMWHNYGLFTLKGQAARLGGGKKDLAALMLYRCADGYLQVGGVLGFVITQTLFKSKGAGDGFRRFQLGDGPKLGVRVVHDLTTLQPFEGATTQTSVLVLERNQETRYPVTYNKWTKRQRVRGMVDAPLWQVRGSCKVDLLAAAPVTPELPNSPWLTAPAALDRGLRAVIGPSRYRAFAGVCTWANGIYWLHLEDSVGEDWVRVRNLAAEAKEGDVEEHSAIIEKEYVRPLVRSRDISHWRASPSAYMLVPQDPRTRTGVEESTLKVYAPRTFAFLAGFREQLSQRSGMLKYFKADRDAFYSVYNVSGGTFAPHKVMWRQMVPRITAAVVSEVDDPILGRIAPVTQHVVSVIGFDREREAHYVCALLNSTVASAISSSYSTGKSFGTPSMLDHIPVPLFDSADDQHEELAELSARAHLLARQGPFEELGEVQDRVDAVAARLFGVDPSLLPDLRQAVDRISAARLRTANTEADELLGFSELETSPLPEQHRVTISE